MRTRRRVMRRLIPVVLLALAALQACCRQQTAVTFPGQDVSSPGSCPAVHSVVASAPAPVLAVGGIEILSCEPRDARGAVRDNACLEQDGAVWSLLTHSCSLSSQVGFNPALIANESGTCVAFCTVAGISSNTVQVVVP